MMDKNMKHKKKQASPPDEVLRAIKQKPRAQLDPGAFEHTRQMVRSELIKQSLRDRKRAFRWNYVFAPAALASVLVIGIFLGKFIWMTQPPAAGPAGTPGDSRQFAHMVVQEYLQEITPLLIHYANSNPADQNPRMMRANRLKSQDLSFQTRFLKTQSGLTEADKELVRLLEELDVLLIEISNMEANKPERLQAVKNIIRSQDLIFKIKFLSSGLKTARQPKNI